MSDKPSQEEIRLYNLTGAAWADIEGGIKRYEAAMQRRDDKGQQDIRERMHGLLDAWLDLRKQAYEATYRRVVRGK